MDCWYESKKLQDGCENRAVKSHFDKSTFVDHTDFCVGARVAISKVNFLPEVGLYNGSIGTVQEIVYKLSSVGPNNKQHCHLPEYAVVKFPKLKLPHHIKPWDSEHKTVSKYDFEILYLAEKHFTSFSLKINTACSDTSSQNSMQ